MLSAHLEGTEQHRQDPSLGTGADRVPVTLATFPENAFVLPGILLGPALHPQVWGMRRLLVQGSGALSLLSTS